MCRMSKVKWKWLYTSSSEIRYWEELVYNVIVCDKFMTLYMKVNLNYVR